MALEGEEQVSMADKKHYCVSLSTVSSCAGCSSTASLQVCNIDTCSSPKVQHREGCSNHPWCLHSRYVNLSSSKSPVLPDIENDMAPLGVIKRAILLKIDVWIKAGNQPGHTCFSPVNNTNWSKPTALEYCKFTYWHHGCSTQVKERNSSHQHEMQERIGDRWVHFGCTSPSCTSRAKRPLSAFSF